MRPRPALNWHSLKQRQPEAPKPKGPWIVTKPQKTCGWLGASHVTQPDKRQTNHTLLGYPRPGCAHICSDSLLRPTRTQQQPQAETWSRWKLNPRCTRLTHKHGASWCSSSSQQAKRNQPCWNWNRKGLSDMSSFSSGVKQTWAPSTGLSPTCSFVIQRRTSEEAPPFQITLEWMEAETQWWLIRYPTSTSFFAFIDTSFCTSPSKSHMWQCQFYVGRPSWLRLLLFPILGTTTREHWKHPHFQ